MNKNILLFFLLQSALLFSQGNIKLAVLKYNGGGDYYANPTALPNLIEFCNSTLETELNTDEVPYVEAGSKDLFDYPFVHMTGHGNVVFSSSEVENLRTYLLAGGFLHIDDNYGMDAFVRTEIRKVFPETDLVELPTNHPIFHGKYEFPNGLPKIHEHDASPAKAYGIIVDGRLVCLYTFESDIGGKMQKSIMTVIT
jgi:hypothetical protein